MYLLTYSAVAGIQEALAGRTSWGSWAQSIITKYPNNKDKNYVNEAFDYWNSSI